jgi:hypothetical protein
MTDQRSSAVLNFVLVGLLAGCAPSSEPPPASDESKGTVSPVATSLRDALSFHASFDNGPDADLARGDRGIYTAPSYDALDEANPGIGNPDVQLAEGVGRFGGALDFTAKNRHAIFYSAEGNVAYDPKGWSGTISLWLKLDPAEDLEPGYCDPFQITDSGYNDAAVWVDFTKENPRQLRLGVFGDLHDWNPEEVSPDDFPAFGMRLVVVDPPPFSRESWTHVVVTYSDLGSEGGGSATLYLDGTPVPDTRDGIAEAFTWDSPGSIRLGLSYVGLLDELALFDRDLTAEEVAALHALEQGVAELHR